MDEDKILNCCLDLMRRLPPNNVELNLAAVIDLAPRELLQDLLSSVDQPLKVMKCAETNNEFLICDYNRDADSYRLPLLIRSPFSNKYQPPLSDGTVPSEKLRKLELRCNTAFERYREMYFEGGISSCYLWDIDDTTFAGVLLIKKAGEGSTETKGCWDSVHVFEVVTEKKTARYKLTSTVMLWLNTQKCSGNVMLCGSMTRQADSSQSVSNFVDDHVKNIGKAIEENENKMRASLNTIYFEKTKDIVNGLRSMGDPGAEKMQRNLAMEMATKLKNKKN